MTAIIVELGALEAVEGLTGTQFSVPLGRDGTITHLGCNWVGCPPEKTAELAAVSGVYMGEDFWALGADLGLALIVPEEPEFQSP